MTKIPMPESLREEIVKIALREVCVTLLVDDQPDASRLKECAVAIAEAGAAAYAATIPKDAESEKRPPEEGRVVSASEFKADLDRLFGYINQIRENIKFDSQMSRHLDDLLATFGRSH